MNKKTRKNKKIYIAILISLMMLSIFVLSANAYVNSSDIIQGVKMLSGAFNPPTNYTSFDLPGVPTPQREAQRRMDYENYMRQKANNSRLYGGSLESECYIDNNCRFNPNINSAKNVPKGPIKLLYKTLGGLKIATKDIPYKPISEYPYRINYWAGARQACIANGMRLPTPDELLFIYEHKAILGKFKKDQYWSSLEDNSCCATSVLFDELEVSDGHEVYLKEISPGRVEMTKDQPDPSRYKYKTISWTENTRQGALNYSYNKGYNEWINLRCVR